MLRARACDPSPASHMTILSPMSDLAMSRSQPSRSVSQKLCPLCSFEAPSVQVILSHLRLVHSNDPQFLVSCGLNGCATTSKSFSSLYSHIYRHHNEVIFKRKESDSSLQGKDCGKVSSEALSMDWTLTGIDITSSI